MRICVIGCGIVGSFLSFFLKEKGVDVVALSRRRKYPKVGLIQSIMQKYQADIYAARRSRELYLKISELLGLYSTVSYVKSYTIIRRDREEYVDRLVDEWRKNGVAVRKLSNDELRELPFKIYNDEVVYLCDNDTIVRIDKIIDKLWREVNVKKCNVALKNVANNVKIYANGKILDENFDKIVICCGSWSRSLLRDIGINVPLIPYKCQAGLFVISTKVSDYILYDYVNKIYVRPCGELSKLGIGKEKVMIAGNGNTPPMEPEEKAEVEPWFVNDITPKLLKRYDKVRYVKGSAGYCDTTPDARPIIAVRNNLIVVSGFDGYGAEIGPAVAEIACKFILGEKLDSIEASFLEDRLRGISELSVPSVEAHEL